MGHSPGFDFWRPPINEFPDSDEDRRSRKTDPGFKGLIKEASRSEALSFSPLLGATAANSQRQQGGLERTSTNRARFCSSGAAFRNRHVIPPVEKLAPLHAQESRVNWMEDTEERRRLPRMRPSSLLRGAVPRRYQKKKKKRPQVAQAKVVIQFTRRVICPSPGVWPQSVKRSQA